MGIRDYPDKPRVYLDMDGVIADFEAEMQFRGLTAKELKRIPGIYKNFPMIDGASQGVFALQSMGWELFILTKIPSENLTAATDKLIWVQENFPSIGERVIITPDKGCVGTEHDFLVDDHPEWANAHTFAGTIVHFGQDVKSWSELVEYFRAHHQNKRHLRST
jgi:5'(3')-deoxyribonucleotidase